MLVPGRIQKDLERAGVYACLPSGATRLTDSTCWNFLDSVFGLTEKLWLQELNYNRVSLLLLLLLIKFISTQLHFVLWQMLLDYLGKNWTCKLVKKKKKRNHQLPQRILYLLNINIVSITYIRKSHQRKCTNQRSTPRHMLCSSKHAALFWHLQKILEEL